MQQELAEAVYSRRTAGIRKKQRGGWEAEKPPD